MTPTYANQVSDLTIDIVIFDVDTCLIVLHVSYILICVIVYESIWLWYDMYMLWYVNGMITLMVWCVRRYVWDRIREGCDKRNVMIWLRYVPHKMIWLGYVWETIWLKYIHETIWLWYV